MTAQQLFESEPLWRRCRKFDKWQLIHFAESYHKHVKHSELTITESSLLKYGFENDGLNTFIKKEHINSPYLIVQLVSTEGDCIVRFEDQSECVDLFVTNDFKRIKMMWYCLTGNKLK